MSQLLNFILSNEEAFKSQARLTSLYSDFGVLKQSNPDGYAANASAWRSALENASKAGLAPPPSNVLDRVPTSKLAVSGKLNSRLAFRTSEHLVKQLEIQNLGRPLALGDVVNDSVTAGTIVPLSIFLTRKIPLSAATTRSWTLPISIPKPYDVAKWLLSQIGFTGEATGSVVDEDFIVLKNVQETANNILANVAETRTNSSSLIFTLANFTSTFQSITPGAAPLTPTDVTIILTYLSRDKQAITLSRPLFNPSASPNDEPLVIKFQNPSDPRPAPITQQDMTIASLRTLNHSLTQQQATLELRIAELTKNLNALIAQTASSPAAKTRALTLLRQRKMLQTTLQRRLDSQMQVEETLGAIDDAATNAELTRAMETSAGVLRRLNEQVGGAEGVQKVMDAVADARAETEEVAAALREGGVEESEVDEEFEEMIRESNAQERSKEGDEDAEVGEAEAEKLEKLEKLPQAPTAELIKKLPSEMSERAVEEREAEMEERMSEMSIEETSKDSADAGKKVELTVAER